MSFEDHFFDLVKCCQSIVKEAETAGLSIRPQLSKSINDCKILLSMYLDDTTKRPLLMKNMTKFFTDNHKHLITPYLTEVEGKMVVSPEAVAWLYPDGAPDAHTGFRGVTMPPNAKRPKICLPLAEVFEISINLFSKLEEDKSKRNAEKQAKITSGELKPEEAALETGEDEDFRTFRVIFLLLKAMSFMKVDDYDTEDILLSAVDLEPMARIGTGGPLSDTSVLADELKKLGFDASGAEQIIKNLLGDNKDTSKILGILTSLFSKVKGGNLGSSLPDILKMIKSVMSSSEEEGAPEEQD